MTCSCTSTNHILKRPWEIKGGKTRPCKENHSPNNPGGINMAGSGTRGATRGENQWRGCLGDGLWYGHHHHAISWNMLPSIELAPKSPQVHRVRIEIRSRTEATQHSDFRLGNKLSNILWRHPCWLLWNCSRLMEMWHMFECSEWDEIGVLLFTCSGTWTLNQHQYIFLGLINCQGQLIRCSDSLMKRTLAKGAGFLLK